MNGSQIVIGEGKYKRENLLFHHLPDILETIISNKIH
jgi:hypothetical protein